MSKIITEYDEVLTSAEDRKEVRLGASAMLGKDYLESSEEDIYSANVGNHTK